jgi:hypothetical protein
LSCPKSVIGHPEQIVNMNSKNTSAVDNIFKINLGVKRSERVIVLSDNYSRELKKNGEYLLSSGFRFL